VKIKAIEANPSAIRHIYNPNKKLQLKAIESNGDYTIVFNVNNEGTIYYVLNLV